MNFRAKDEGFASCYRPTSDRSLQNNLLIRETICKHGLRYWQVADLLNVSANTLSRMLRHELDKSEQQRICRLIEEGFRYD